MLVYVFGRVAAQVHTANDGFDGLKVCQRIRELSHVPFIILTAMNCEGKVVEGLECGADDFVTKLFAPDGLQARAWAPIRRTAFSIMPENPMVYHDEHLTVDR